MARCCEVQGKLATGEAASSQVQAAPAPKASFASDVADLGSSVVWHSQMVFVNE